MRRRPESGRASVAESRSIRLESGMMSLPVASVRKRRRTRGRSAAGSARQSVVEESVRRFLYALSADSSRNAESSARVRMD